MRKTIGGVLAVLAWQASPVFAAEPRSAPAPTLQIGDRWVYKVTDRDGMNRTESEETREVTAIGPGGITIAVRRSRQGGVTARTEEFSAPGLLRSGEVCVEGTRRFPDPLQQYAFPLAPGKRWNNWFEYVTEPGGRKGKLNYTVRVRGWEQLGSAGGSVDALRMLVIIRLDDSDAFRHATECHFTVWYAPSARGTVREQRSGGYLGRGSAPTPTRLIDATYELARFTPGKP